MRTSHSPGDQGSPIPPAGRDTPAVRTPRANLSKTVPQIANETENGGGNETNFAGRGFIFALLGARAYAADHIKLGFEAGMSGSLGIVGEEMKRGLDLALELLDNKLGGVPITLYAVDDQTVPAIAVQQASKLVDEDKVDIVTGIMLSNTN